MKSDGNEIELKGETGDEDMYAEQPTANEYKEHMTTHQPYRSWCEFSVMVCGVNSPHWRSDAQEDLEGEGI